MPTNQNVVVIDLYQHVAPAQDINGYAQTPLVDANQRAFNTPSPTTGQTQTGSANATNTITLAALGAGLRYYMSGFTLTFTGGAPTGTLIVKDGGSTIWNADVIVQYSGATAGLMDFDFAQPMQNTAGNSMAVSCSALGTGVVSRISLQQMNGP